MPAKPQEDLINFAFGELNKAIAEAKAGKTPHSSYGKLKKVYDTLAEANRKRENKEITEEEMEATMTKEVNKLKEI